MFKCSLKQKNVRLASATIASKDCSAELLILRITVCHIEMGSIDARDSNRKRVIVGEKSQLRSSSKSHGERRKRLDCDR